ncbi:MAG: GyrI-like domain-containing protein [Chloroflexota bacterium]|nr:GyrI-like domain-containing protein [bacterium]MDE2896744.1 GyrI-like domain-containing protein [Chloroflexota bacterium]
MRLSFETKEIGAQPMLAIRTTSPMDKLEELLGSLFGEVYGYIQERGEQPAGMPFSRYHSMDGTTVDLECGMPVASPMEGKGRVQAGELPAGSVATVTHLGPYDGLPQTWSALTEWMASEGHNPAGAPWEVYVTDPGAEPDQSKWRTEIYFPVR